MPRPTVLVAMIVSLTAAACGGGGGGSSDKAVTIYATPELTGSVSAGGEFLMTDIEPAAGDLVLTTEEGTRGFISFVSSIP